MDIFKLNKKNRCGPRATRWLQIIALQVIVLFLLFFPKDLSSATAPIFNWEVNSGVGNELYDGLFRRSDVVQFSRWEMEHGSSSGFLWKGEGEVSSLFSIYGIVGFTGRVAWQDLGFGGFKDYLSLEADAYTEDPYLSPMMHYIVLGIRQHPFLGWDPLQFNPIRSLDLTFGFGISTSNIDILFSVYGVWGTSDFSGSSNTLSLLGDLGLFFTLDPLEKSHQIFLKAAGGASLSNRVELGSLNSISDSAFAVKGSLGYSYSQLYEEDEFRDRAWGFDLFYAHSAYLYDNSAFNNGNRNDISSVESRLKQTDELTVLFTIGKVIGIKAFYNFRLSYSDAELFLPGNCRGCDPGDSYFNPHYFEEDHQDELLEDNFYRSQMDDYREHSLGIEFIYPTRFVVAIRATYAGEIRDYYRRVDFLNQNSKAPIFMSEGPTALRQQVKVGLPIKFCEGLTSSFEPFYEYNYEHLNGFNREAPNFTIQSHGFGIELQYRIKGTCQA